jgi:selenocysteine-specific elongation factor
VTGTVWSGRLARDGVVRILPGDRQARVRGIQSHGAQVDCAEAGNRTAIALAGVDVADVGRGSVLVSDSGWAASMILRAEVALLPAAPQPLRARSAVRFHLGTAESGARVVVAGGALAPGERKPARIVLDEPMVLRAGDRFVLRSASPLATVGGGIVIDPFAPRRGRAWSDPERLPARRLELALAEAGPAGVLVGTLPVRLGVSPGAAEAIVRESDPVSLPASGRVVAREFLRLLGDQLLAFVEEAHRSRPLEPGPSLQLARSKLAAPVELVDRVIADQVETGRLAVAAGIIRLAGWSPRPSAVQAGTIEEVHQALVAAAHEPPSVSELTERFGPETESFLRFLERLGRVTQVEQGRYYDSRELELLVDRLRTGMERDREYSPADLREVLGSSRKYLIPLLEYCDRMGLTSRGTTGRMWRGT